MLQSSAALESCFGCVRRALRDDGMFVFDLMTRRGFWRDYNSMWVADTEDELYVLKSVYDGGERAATRMTGFVRGQDGHWERFEEFRTPTLFPAAMVVAALRKLGWSQVRVGRPLARSSAGVGRVIGPRYEASPNTSVATASRRNTVAGASE